MIVVRTIESVINVSYAIIEDDLSTTIPSLVTTQKGVDSHPDIDR